MARFRSGYVLMHRKILDSWIGRDGVALAIFTKLVLDSNYKRSKEPLRGQLVTIERGQIPIGVEKFAESLGFDRKTVERKLKMLEDDHVIVQQVSNRGRIITLVKYDQYQFPENGVVQQKSNRRPTEGATDARHSGKEKTLPSGEEQKDEVPPLAPLAGGETGSKSAKRKSRRRLHEEADEAALEVVSLVLDRGAVDQAVAEASLSADAYRLMNRAFGRWTVFLGLFDSAIKQGDLEPFLHRVRPEFRTAARLLAKGAGTSAGDEGQLAN
jgi:biotin operon repressor